MTRTSLWKNADDSIRHACDHFSKLQEVDTDRDHHVKWALLSIHHAAECFCTVLLFEVNPSHPDLPHSDSSRFPGLRRVVDTLVALTQKVSLGERRVLELFRRLVDTRDQIMHRTLPENLEISIAAMSLLGLLRIARRRFGENAFDIDGRLLPADVFQAIRSAHLEEYYRIAEQLVCEEYPNQGLQECPNCGRASIVASACEVCFEEMSSIECPETQEEVLYPSWQRWWADKDPRHQIEVECPYCSKTHLGATRVRHGEP